MAEKHDSHEHKLNEISATAVCGNDILSSVLYVSGFAVAFSGVLAPVVLIIIALVLYFYKSVYTEVVEALPINGGAYNCLLNSTAKPLAAIAGVTTVLSYIATAVISAKVGVEYLHTLEHIFPGVVIPVIPLTIALLLLFAFLVIGGIKDSAKVALAIFGIHFVTLVIFVILGAAFYFSGHSFFMQNVAQTQQIFTKFGGWTHALFLGFSASLLGVSGFESSANFVEEQQKGVFRKTLRNMLIAVAIFNPLVALISLNSSSITTIIGAKDFLLADEAAIIGGVVFQVFVVIDAFMVLSGAVLTSFIGVSGLMSRMSADGCLPNFLSTQNKKGSFPLIIGLFFLLCTSILLITKGELSSLAGVYTIAFLGVMSLFALGNLIMRETRTELKRTYYARTSFVVLAFFATCAGIIGNILIDPRNFVYFGMYFVPAVILVLMMVFQDENMTVLIRLTRPFPALNKWLVNSFEDMTEGKFVAFVHNVNRLYPILSYIDRSETSRNVILVHCNNGEGRDYEKSFKEMEHILPELQKAGMFTDMKVKMYFLDKPFSPPVIGEISRRFKVRKNRILIGSIHHHHPYEYSELGGVRIIF